MNKISEILVEQYKDLCEERSLLEDEIRDLPLGSIQEKKIKNGTYYYRQYREGGTVKTVFIPNVELEEIKNKINRRKEIEKRLKEIREEIEQVIRGLGSDVYTIEDFEDFHPVKNIDYKDYTVYMSHLAHEIKRLGKEEFLIEYENVKGNGVKARYLRGLIDYIANESISKPYKSANIVLDPLTYQLYFEYGNKGILKSMIKKAIPEFLRQGLLITNIQEAVGGTFS